MEVDGAAAPLPEHVLEASVHRVLRHRPGHHDCGVHVTERGYQRTFFRRAQALGELRLPAVGRGALHGPGPEVDGAGRADTLSHSLHYRIEATRRCHQEHPLAGL
jgi:hypothetical protein